jgi:hypothetical protein
VALPLTLAPPASSVHLTIAAPVRAIRERFSVTSSPLGRYADLVASLVTLGIVGVALTLHVLEAFGVSSSAANLGWTDQLAFAVVGFVFASVARAPLPASSSTPATPQLIVP